MKSEPRDTAFSMCIVSGPFTPEGDLNYDPLKTLFDFLILQKPDVVLLVISSSSFPLVVLTGKNR